MRIAIYGDSSVDPAQIIQCRQISPHLPDHVFENTWISRLNKIHEVQVFSQMSASTAWVDEQWRLNKDNFDLNIIKAPAFDKMHVNYPDNWNDLHAKVLLGIGPIPAVYLSKYQTVEGQKSDIVHWVHLNTHFGMNRDHMARQFNLYSREWEAEENTFVITHLGHNESHKDLEHVFTTWKINSSGTFEAEAKKWYQELLNEYPDAKFKVDPMLMGHLYHRWPYHLHPAAHDAMYEHVEKIIKFGIADEPIPVLEWKFWSEPHPILDQIKEEIIQSATG